MANRQPWLGFVCLFLGLGLSVGCQNPASPNLPVEAAPPQIEASFQIRQVNENGFNVTVVGLKKSSLGKYFLLIPQLRSAGAAGQLNLFEPQVVYFKASGAQVGLFELNTAAIYQDIYTDQLMQSFKVRFETEDFIFFDWNYGIEAVVARTPWDGGSPGTRKDFTEGSNALIDVVQSFVEKAEFKDNVLRVRQVSKIRETILRFGKDPSQLTPADMGIVGTAEKRDSSVTLDMVIRPYEAKSKVQPVTSKLDRGFGYFTRLLAKPGNTQARDVILKWDITPERGPIRVRVSQNVPGKLIPAVIDGIKYWNRVIGRDVLVIETGVSPQAELEERSISVHWVDWRDAGFAYAGFQSDPLTGEILQGQVFMTSSWLLAGGSYDDLRGSAGYVQPRPQGTQPLNSSCRYHYDQARSWAQSVSLPTETIDTALSHVIRNVVAHEVGHALGLRHNFAASFYAPVDPQVQLQKTEEFLKVGTITGLPTSISVMDYASGIDDVMLGKFIQNETLEYDRQVIAWGYLNDQSQARLRFCTDHQRGSTIGCDVFDSNALPTAYSIKAETLRRDRGLWRDHAQIMMSVFPEEGQREELDDVLNLKEKLLANQPAPAVFGATRAVLTEEKSVLSTRDLKNWESPEAVKTAKTESWQQQANAVGLLSLFDFALPWVHSVDDFGFTHMILDAGYYDRQLQRIVAQPRFSEGRNLAGVSYKLSVVESQRIEKFLRLRLSQDVFVPGITALTQVLPGPNKVVLNSQTRAPEKKVLFYQKLQSLKNEMPQIRQRSLQLMLANSSGKTISLGDNQTLYVPTRVFAPTHFYEWPPLFHPRFNPNCEPALYDQLLAELKHELKGVYALWGIANPTVIATAELRRLYSEKSSAWPIEAKSWMEAELQRLEHFEKFKVEAAKF